MTGPYRASSKDKTLSACDECRARKLKCSGEPTGCSRCVAERTPCHYSLRKTMGRPRKRLREEEDYLQTHKGGLGPFGDMNNGDSVQRQSGPDLAALSRDEMETREPRTVNDRVDAHGVGLPGIDGEIFGLYDTETIFPDQDLFNLAPASGFPTWDSPQDLHTFLPMDSTNPGQLQTPYGLVEGATSSPFNNTQDGCTCLGSLYQTLGTFQPLPAPSFPYSMGALKKAAVCGYKVVRCQKCPQAYNTAIQNSMLLGALLQMIINEYAKLLKHINDRAASGESMAFRIGEVSSCFDVRHTGTFDCPMAINVDLSGEEWRMLARKAVRREVLGSAESNECLLDIIQEMRDRQVVWHESFSQGSHPGQSHLGIQPEGDKGNTMCVQLTYIDHLERQVQALKL